MASEEDVKQLHTWTSCQVYGHNFVEGRCSDCGERAELDEEIVICAGDEEQEMSCLAKKM